MCKHLQANLQRLVPNQSVKAIPISFIEAKEKPVIETKEEQRFKMIAKLKAHALPDIYIAVLVYKFVYGWSLAEIAEKLHIINKQTCFNIYKKGIELLKERNYR